MVVFLSSLRHPKVSSDYRRVEQMFELCARSVCSQTSNAFRFVVVCHQIPEIDFHDPRIEYHLVDWPAPVSQPDQSRSESHYLLDKGLKIALAAWLARKYDPTYLFLIDADDWICRQIVEYTECTPSKAGFVVDKGHFVDWQIKEYKRRRGLNRYCGSTICSTPAAFFSLTPGLQQIKNLPTQPELKYLLSHRFLHDGIGDHRLPQFLQETGLKMRPFPFFAAAWVANYGDNMLGSFDSHGGRSFSPQFCDYYGLPLSVIDDLGRKLPSNRLRETIAYGRSTLEWWLQRATGQMRF